MLHQFIHKLYCGTNGALQKSREHRTRTTRAHDTTLSSGTPVHHYQPYAYPCLSPLATISISISMTKSNQQRQLLETSSQTSPKTLKYKILNINHKGGWEGPKTSSSGSQNSSDNQGRRAAASLLNNPINYYAVLRN